MILQSLKMAWKSIVSNKMRSFLTMLGIIIGVTSLVVLVSIVESATGSVTSSISSMGNDRLTIRISDDKGKPYTWEEVMALSEDESYVEVVPQGSANMTASHEGTSESITITGTTNGYEEVMQLDIDNGRFIKYSDVENNNYVAVINEYTATTLFGHSDVVDQSISLDGIEFTIVGVLAEEESMSMFSGERMEAYIPYSTLMRVSNSVSDVNLFYLTAAPEVGGEAAELAITATLSQRFEADTEAFTISNQAELAETMESVTNTMALMLGGIAGISLLVGGIGIMNIMLVSVTERTREIGIRKAIGATYFDIVLQFMIEAIVISLMGCLIGIILSWGAVSLVGVVMVDYIFALSMDIILIAVVFSLFVGVVFGSYPANKAAKKNPIEALRFS